LCHVAFEHFRVTFLYCFTFIFKLLKQRQWEYHNNWMGTTTITKVLCAYNDSFTNTTIPYFEIIFYYAKSMYCIIVLSVIYFLASYHMLYLCFLAQKTICAYYTHGQSLWKICYNHLLKLKSKASQILMHYCSSQNSIQEGTIFLTDQIYQHLLNLKSLKARSRNYRFCLKTSHKFELQRS